MRKAKHFGCEIKNDFHRNQNTLLSEGMWVFGIFVFSFTSGVLLNFPQKKLFFFVEFNVTIYLEPWKLWMGNYYLWMWRDPTFYTDWGKLQAVEFFEPWGYTGWAVCLKLDHISDSPQSSYSPTFWFYQNLKLGSLWILYNYI